MRALFTVCLCWIMLATVMTYKLQDMLRGSYCFCLKFQVTEAQNCLVPYLSDFPIHTGWVKHAVCPFFHHSQPKVSSVCSRLLKITVRVNRPGRSVESFSNVQVVKAYHQGGKNSMLAFLLRHNPPPFFNWMRKLRSRKASLLRKIYSSNWQ